MMSFDTAFLKGLTNLSLLLNIFNRAIKIYLVYTFCYMNINSQAKSDIRYILLSRIYFSEY